MRFIRNRRLPAFLGVGAQKSGTTTLYARLAEHPEIFLPECKELHYFSLHFGKDLSWYLRSFESASSCQKSGEITPYYLFHPQAAQRIRRKLGKVKILILLRDPVERTLSHYWHARRHGFEHLPLQQALDAESLRLVGAEQILRTSTGRHQAHQELSYVSRSLYRTQVKRFWRYFGRKNVLVLPSERMFTDALPSFDVITRFLGVSPFASPLQASDACGAANVNPIRPGLNDYDGQLMQQLRDRLADSYEFARCELSWGRDLPWRW